MGNVTLITDIDSQLGSALLKHFINKGHSVIGTTSATDKATNFENLDENQFIKVGWRRNSPVSARNILLKAFNKFKTIDQAMVINSPLISRKLVHEITFTEIDEVTDNWIKGTLFIVKEVLKHFVGKNSGILSLINYSSQDSTETIPPFDGTVKGSFDGLVRSLFSSYAGGEIYINAFQSYSSLTEEFAQYIYKTLEDREGKIFGKNFHFQNRQGIISKIFS